LEFCTGKDCILIDDLKKNIEAWESFGGTGIHHTSAEETISKLREPGNELSLFRIVREQYPDVLYQYRPEWLGRQSLDLYIYCLCAQRLSIRESSIMPQWIFSEEVRPLYKDRNWMSRRDGCAGRIP
jgi:hypothetical protein